MGTEVTLIEFMDNIVPVEDEEVSKQLAEASKSRHDVMTGTEVTEVKTSAERLYR